MQRSFQIVQSHTQPSSVYRTRRSLSVLAALVLGLALVSHAPSAHAAPIVVTYTLTGGTTGGSFGVGTVIDGSVSFLFPNPLNLTRGSFTGGSAFITALTFVGTAGSTAFTPWSISHINVNPSVFLAPGGTLSTGAPFLGSAPSPYTWTFIANSLVPTAGGFANWSGSTNYSGPTSMGSFFWSGVTGHEQAIPEPATSSLLGFSLLVAAAVGTGMRRLSRRT
jgi:hypothetical protein